jgi:predicted nucleic acid-binding protein
MSLTSAPSGLREIYIVDSWPSVEIPKGKAISRMSILLDAAARGETSLLLSEMNLGEIFYLIAKDHSPVHAEKVLRYVQRSPCKIVSLAPGDAMNAARLKAVYKISYADAFVAALAIEHRAPIVTGDPDFLKLRDLGVVDVEWLER